MKRLNKTEKAILLAAILALLIFSFLLYDDSILIKRSNLNDQDAIGRVSRTINDVRRKNLSQLAWIPTSQSDPIFQEDSIFTGDKSEANIQLNDGTLIKVNPNSLITMNFSNGEMKLDLKYGDLEGDINANSKLILSSNNEQYILNGDDSKISIKKNYGPNLNLNLLSGKLQIKSKSTNKELNQNESMTLSDDKLKKSTKAINPKITNMSPSNLMFLKDKSSVVIKYSWNADPAPTNYEIEVSTDLEFKNILQVYKTNSPSYTSTLLSTEGTFYWRVKSFDQNYLLVSTSNPAGFKISSLPAPNILKPTDKSILNLELPKSASTNLKTLVNFEWKVAYAFQYYQIHIANDSAFNQIVFDSNYDKTVAGINLQSGHYWARIRGFTTLKNPGPWSYPVEFELNLKLKKLDNIPPQSPVLAKKSIKYKPDPKTIRSPAAVKGPVISWNAKGDIDYFKFELSRDKQFKNKSTVNVKNSTFLWQEVSTGKFYYRVSAVGLNKLVSAPSEIGELTVDLESPTLGQIKSIRHRGKKIGGKPPTLGTKTTWTFTPHAVSYIIELDKSKLFKAPTRFKVIGESFDLPVSVPGKYFARVYPLDRKYKPISNPSNIVEFKYDYDEPIAPPELREPNNNASIFLQSAAEPFIWIYWNNTQGAKKYKVEISNTPDFNNPLISTESTKNRFLIKNRLPLGKIYWRVKAFAEDKDNISDWSTPREFNLLHKKNERFDIK